jgi:MFS family permease
MSTSENAATTSGSRAGLQTTAIGLGALMAALTQTLVLPVLPTITRDIGASESQATWLLTSTLLVAAVAVPIISRFADMWGRRLMLQISLTALAVGSLIDALTDDPVIMIIGRALTGLSAAAIPLGISLLAATLPPERRGSAMALVSAMLGVGGALGLPLAGVIGDNFDYHILFWIGVVGAVVSLVLVTAVVRETATDGDTGVDVAGIVLLAGGLVCLVLPLAEGTAWGWGSPLTLGLFAACVVLLVALVVVERRVRNPLVDMTALSNPPVLITNIASVFVGFALFASFVGTSNYVQAPEATGYGFGSTVLVAGLTLMPSGVLMLVLSPVAAQLIKRWGGGRVLTLAGLIIAAGLIMRIFATGSLAEVVIGSAIVGVGTGVGYAALPSLISAHSRSEELAAANGINALARSLGSSLASAVGGSILAALTIDLGGTAVPSLTGYRVLFAICAGAAVLAAVGGVAVSMLGRRRGPDVTADQPDADEPRAAAVPS